MSDQNAFVNAYIENAMAMVHDQINGIVQLKTQLKIAEVTLDQKAAEVEQLNEALRSAGEVNSELGSLRGSNNSLLEENVALSQKVSHMDTLLRQVGEMKQEIISRDSTIETLQNEISNFQSRYTEIENERNGLLADKSLLFSEKTRFESDISGLDNDRSRLETENSNLEAEKSRLEAERSNLVSDKSRLEAEKSRLEDEKSQLQVQFEAKQSDLETEVSKLQIEKLKLEEEVKKLKTVLIPVTPVPDRKVAINTTTKKTTKASIDVTPTAKSTSKLPEDDF